MYINIIYLNQYYRQTLKSMVMQRMKYIVNLIQNNIYTIQLQRTWNF
jgi:hypothetical protein